MVAAQAQQQLYSHAAEPKAVQQRRAKYREDEPQVGGLSANIMFDRRIVRGNTYAARILPLDATSTIPKSTSATSLRKKSVRQAPPRTPEAVEGRRHMDIQTDTYLEELTDIIPEADNATQTDAFLDRPPTPLFVPQKTGLDAATQIERGDLFDFDFEVEPILEVLVGKVLEQGLMEVLEEEELAALRAHQEHFEQIRNAELVAAQRMEAAERRKLEEKERRLAQERERLERERVVRRKVAASAFSRGYLSGIVNTVFDRLQNSGFFYDPVLREVETRFMPWLKEEAASHLEKGRVARGVAAKLIADAGARLTEAKEEAASSQASFNNAATEWEQREAAALAAFQGVELEAIRARPAFILRELRPAIASMETIENATNELKATAEAEANAKYEELKAAAAETARAVAEAALEKQRQQLEELTAKAVEAAAERGEDPPTDPPTLDEPMVDVEAEITKAMEAVVKPEPREITDTDILSFMLDRGLLTKDTIVHSLAVNSLGNEAFTKHPSYNPVDAEQ